MPSAFIAPQPKNGEVLEGTEADARFSKDDEKRALAILKLEGNPSVREIKKAYRLRDVHPDKQEPHLKVWGEKEMQEVNWAYGVLSRKMSRASEVTKSQEPSQKEDIPEKDASP